MINNEKHKLLIHIDVDSPLKLLDFYKIKNCKFSLSDLESFYEISFERIFDFLENSKLKASIFVVGEEIEKSEKIQNVIKKAHLLGHEIENHSYTHPFGLSELTDSQITNEIVKCSEIISRITGRKPVGFRAPGYSINTKIINILKENGFKYDSSGFWSIMNPILEYGHKFLFKNGLEDKGFGYVSWDLPQEPYQPSNVNWQTKAETSEDFLEIPLPRTKFFGLPFYNNINLWAPAFYSYFISKTINRNKLIYLFHASEFVDMTDTIPKELECHPNMKLHVGIKIRKSEKIVKNLLKRYTPDLLD